MKKILLLLAFLPALALAQTIIRDGVSLSPAQEQRAEGIGAQLRCLVCQNESIEDSSANLAKQLRVIIREKVVAGASSKDILNYMVRRYGVFVLLKPPFSKLTLLLYASPILGLLAGFFALCAIFRNRAAGAAPLSAAEAARVEKLLER